MKKNLTPAKFFWHMIKKNICLHLNFLSQTHAENGQEIFRNLEIFHHTLQTYRHMLETLSNLDIYCVI